MIVQALVLKKMQIKNEDLTLTEGRDVRMSIMPHSASCEATLSLLIEPMHGFVITDIGFGATFE